MSELVAELTKRARAINDRVVAEMWQNPFWEERFGARGRKFTEEDGLYHLSYLNAALAAEDATPLTRYATWLRTVLVSRGMCTRHLAENFQRLALAIAAESLPGGEVASVYLAQAVEALAYTEGAGRELQLDAAGVAARATEALYARHPEWDRRFEARCLDDLEYHLAYLADAVAANRPELFTKYVTFVAGFLARRNVPASHLEEALVALADQLRGRPALAAARGLLREAVSVVRKADGG